MVIRGCNLNKRTKKMFDILMTIKGETTIQESGVPKNKLMQAVKSHKDLARGFGKISFKAQKQGTA